MRIGKLIKASLFVLAAALAPQIAMAQEANVAFAGLKTDISQPVQVTADQLSVDQATGTAVFSGNVVVTQGDMKLQAGKVTVVYSADKKAVQSLHAEGGIILAAGTDAASADSADYMPDSGDLILTGNVVLTQGQTALSGGNLTLSLKSGTGTMSGRVTTVFTPGNN